MALIFPWKEKYCAMGVVADHDWTPESLANFEVTFLSKAKNTRFQDNSLKEWTHAKKTLSYEERLIRLLDVAPDWLSFYGVEKDLVTSEIEVNIKNIEFHFYDVFSAWGCYGGGQPIVSRIVDTIKDVVKITDKEKFLIFPVQEYWEGSVIKELAKEALSVEDLISYIIELIEKKIVPNNLLAQADEYRDFLNSMILCPEIEPKGKWDKIFILNKKDILSF